jgi:hypothetical protein
MRLIPAIACLAVMAVGASWAQGQAASAKPGAAEKSAVGKQAQEKQVEKGAAKAAALKALLPDAFAGWIATGPAKKLTDPAEADSANAAALKEYDFDEGATADYKRSGETLSLRLLRFHDASGA